MTEFLDTLLKPFRALPAWVGVSAAFQRASGPYSLSGSDQDIASYHRMRSDSGTLGLSDRVWQDLELEGVFRKADFCTSAVGQQVLYDMLRRPDTSPRELRARDALIRSLEKTPELGEAVRRALSRLRNRATYDLFRLFEEDLPKRTKLWAVFPLLTAVAVVGLLTLFLSPGVGVLLLTVVLCTNVGIKLYFRPRFEHLIRPMTSLPALIEAGEALTELDSPALVEYVDSLQRRCRALSWLKGTARRLVVEDSPNELISSLATWASLLFLMDVNAFVVSVERLRRSRDDLRAVFRAVGTIDALLAVGSFRAAVPHWSCPTFTTARTKLDAEGIFHPLLPNPVTNDLHVDGRSLLITGSNMAGKSTYLRAVGTCAVMAQTVATVPGRSWLAPPLRIETLAQRRDDLVGGRSYFLAEADRVKEMLDMAAGEEVCLFIIDELFRGTNTAERVAAASAVLEQLDRAGHICLVATHDMELLAILGARWDYWHFSETVDLTELSFDYTARPGVATRPNALRLLEHLKYPPAVIQRAYETHRALAKPSDET